MPAISFTDPLYASQWYLVNSGQRGGSSRLDLNVVPAWQLGFNGSGVRVAINDDGMDLTHPDLRSNIESSSVYDTDRGTTGSGFVGTDDEHGTVVGSIVGMLPNSIGGVGIAYRATLLPALVGSVPATAHANLFASNLATRTDVSINSWGADPAFAENFGASGSAADRAWGTQLLTNATTGRNGLGMVIEVSAGNQRPNAADAALSNFTNNKVTISVAAVDERGVVTDYSTVGASNLLAAFGGTTSDALEQSTNQGFGIVAADIQGAAGYNRTAGSAGDYSYQNTGTSYSGPMVGAAAALMLQANPNLGFRDVSTILAATARQTDATNTSWVTNGASNWNGTGMHFSRDYGFGLLDVSAAVRLAQSWNAPAGTMSNWVSSSGAATAAAQAIPDDATRSLLVNARINDAVQIERVEVDLDLTATSPSQLKAELTSPAGTTITLFNRPLTRSLVNNQPNLSEAETAWPGVFTIGVTGFLGESSAGTWNLRLTDLVSGTAAQFNSATIRTWGAASPQDNQFIFTDEYARQRTINDSDGTDTLNAAAVSQSVRLDLSRGTQSQIASTGLIIDSSTTIENAIGGAGNDTIVGNASANLLRGNSGNDTINGAAGTDTVPFQGRLSEYRVNISTGNGTVTDTVTLRDGTDTLSSIESLRFSDFTINTGSKAAAASVNAATLQRVIELYVAFFNRTPDADGLAYWLGQAAQGLSINQIAESFYSAGAQYTSLTGFSSTMTNADFVNVIYRNVLGRTAGADADGLAYWTGELASGRASRGSLVSTMLDSAHTFQNNPTWGWVANLLDNKILVARQVAVDWGLNYLTADASVSNGMAIARAVTSTDTTAALALVGIPNDAVLLA